MSKITREEVLEILKKRIKKLDLHNMGEFEYEAQEFTNKEFTKVINFINQQPTPQLSESVEENYNAYDKFQIELESYIDRVGYLELEPYLIDVLNLIQAQASEIERLKKYEKYALSVGSIQSTKSQYKTEKILELESKLNAMRKLLGHTLESFEDNGIIQTITFTKEDAKFIKQILKGDNNEENNNNE